VVMMVRGQYFENIELQQVVGTAAAPEPTKFSNGYATG
jgi:hypothetical protein